MKLPKSSKSARRRAAWKARRDARTRPSREASADLAPPIADRIAPHAYASIAAAVPEGTRIVDSSGGEYEVSGPPSPAQPSQPSGVCVPLRRTDERAAAAPARRVLHRSMGWSPLLGLAMAATVAGAADGLRVESTPLKKEEE